MDIHTMVGDIRAIILRIIQVTILPTIRVITLQFMPTPMIINTAKEDREAQVYREMIWVIALPVAQQEHHHATRVL
jgi:hypothetical protein